MQAIFSTPSRVESYFPELNAASKTVFLLSTTSNSLVPPLDLLKLSTFLRRRGYLPRLHRGRLAGDILEPYAVVLTSVFSWEIPHVRRSLSVVKSYWPDSKRILTGILPRKFGDGVQREFDVNVFDEKSERLLDNETPDYDLTPEWDASIVITSKGICPRECSHCETAARIKGATKLITKWHEHLNPHLPRVEVWDNTLFLTPRDHFRDVTQRLGDIDKPVDFVCGITPSGVDETELYWRLEQLAQVRVIPARLECNCVEDLPRFFRLLKHARTVLSPGTCFRAFAVVNGTEDPAIAETRINQMRAEIIDIDIICFAPHNWQKSRPYVNKATGWSLANIERLQRKIAAPSLA
jgi:hypothetical protein